MAESIFNSQVVAACITGFVTITGWTATNYILRRRENRNKLLQLKLEHISRQIEELYGPLFSLVDQLDNYYNSKQKILAGANLDEQRKEEFNVFLRENYFYQLHQEIRQLLKEKYHLIKENQLPQSFKDYLEHSIQETLQIDIWDKLKLSTANVEGMPWPDQFDKDARQSLNTLKEEYDRLLEQLN